MILTKATGIIMGPLSRLMGWIFNLIYNLFYGLNIYSIGFSIIVFTFIVRLLLFPINLKTTKSSKIQQYLQPEFNKITKKYKGKKDQDSMMKQNKEMSDLRKKYGIKTSTGCLTALIQMPIFFSLYNVIANVPAYVGKVRVMYEPIANAIFGANNGFNIINTFVDNNRASLARLTTKIAEFSSTTDAASETGRSIINAIIDVLAKCSGTLFDQLKEVFSASPEVIQAIESNQEAIVRSNDFFGINLTEAPGFHMTRAFIIPVFCFICQYLSMKVMPMQKTGDEQQDQAQETMRKTMIFMPVMSFVFTVFAPAGLGLYWAMSALVGVLITVFTNMYYDHVDMEKLVEQQMEKAEKEREKKGNKKSFMDRMMESAYGQGGEAEHADGMSKYSSTKLKNYSSPSSYNNENQSSSAEDRTDTGKKYKAGSISARANSVRDYNNKGE